MHGPTLPQEIPLRVSLLPAWPVAPTSNIYVRALFTATVFAGLIASPALAQDPGAQPAQAAPVHQTDGYGTDVFADTLKHTTPHPMPRFTDTKSAQGEEEEAHAQVRAPGPSDDYDNSTPTAWWVYTGQTAAQVSSLCSSLNARIIDISVDSTAPLFTVTLVSNTGAYGKGWWWYYGVTAAQVSSFLSTNKARPISLKAYVSGGQTLFAVVMIPNSGADFKTYWWYYGESASNIGSFASDNNARLVTLDPYSNGSGTVYTTIMISNTGADADSWWWYYDASPATIASAVSSTGARIFYMSAGADAGNFNVLMEGCSSGCSEWWYYYGESVSGLLSQASQNGARLVDVTTYPGCGSTCYAGAMINNSNAITTRVGNLIRNGLGSGVQGLYLKQVGGSVLAALEDGTIYEPASSIKALANLYSMTKVENGSIHLTTPITHYSNGADSCPTPPVVDGTETLGLAIREMMWHSDNTRTREITDHFTDSAINNYVHSIGMHNSGFYDIVGCGGPIPNQLTLDDADVLYEGVAQQHLLNAANRGIFYSNMAGRAQYESEGYDWTGVWDTDIPNLINEVAPAGTTTAQKSAYMALMDTAYKAGNYVFCENSSCTDIDEDIAITGWFQLPFCSSSATTYHEYVWGIFFSNVASTGWSSGVVTQTDSNFNTAKSELMREQIAAGMASCKGKSLEVMTYSPADLVFTSTTVGTSSKTQSVKVTNKQHTSVTGLGVTIFGDFTETNNCKSTLKAGASCTIDVTFKPTLTGERTGAVIVSDGGTGEPQTIQLTGTGS
jgi:hypothetical protein